MREEVGKIVRDRELDQRFCDLIHNAIAKEESLLENGSGSQTMEVDVTL